MAQRINLTLDQGSTYNANFIISDPTGNTIDFSVFTLETKMADYFGSANSYAFQTQGFANSMIRISLDANTSANVSSGRYVYDIIGLDTANNTIRLVEGVVTVTPQV